VLSRNSVLTSVKKYPNRLLSMFSHLPKTDRLGLPPWEVLQVSRQSWGFWFFCSRRRSRRSHCFFFWQKEILDLNSLSVIFKFSALGFSASDSGSGTSGSLSMVGASTTTSSVAGFWCSLAMNK
jgi:hypothetical protein